MLSRDGSIGIGFISWGLLENPSALAIALTYKPSVVMLSFLNPPPKEWIDQIHEAGSLVMLQIQNVEDAVLAYDIGADIIAAQGTEAGGHGLLQLLLLLLWLY